MLKKKVGEFSRLLEAERSDRLAQTLIMGVVDEVGLGQSRDSTNDYSRKSRKTLYGRYPSSSPP